MSVRHCHWYHQRYRRGHADVVLPNGFTAYRRPPERGQRRQDQRRPQLRWHRLRHRESRGSFDTLRRTPRDDDRRLFEYVRSRLHRLPRLSTNRARSGRKRNKSLLLSRAEACKNGLNRRWSSPSAIQQRLPRRAPGRFRIVQNGNLDRAE